MTAKADFTEEEWTTVLEGPTSAGLIVVTAQKGGSIRETFSMAEAYTDARKEPGQSELLDAIVNTKPEVDHERMHSAQELKEHNLQNIRDALALVESKASADEVEQYKGFIVRLAERVAERVKGVSDTERTAVSEIAETLGTEAPSAGS
ncbi:MAG: hypothetical protein ACXWEL_08730 [Solirubrobacterales bacterium]